MPGWFWAAFRGAKWTVGLPSSHPESSMISGLLHANQESGQALGVYEGTDCIILVGEAMKIPRLPLF